MDMDPVNAGEAEALRDKFEDIYPLETEVLGYEYGGGPGATVPGGKDGDDRIQILVYDFYPGITVTSGVAGFFWGKDFFPESYFPTQKSNEAEIFYINAQFLNSSPDFIYSTLVHEFQHMINFNVKNVKYGTNPNGTWKVQSEAWYNEMLSMMAEDMISPLIGIDHENKGHPTPSRINDFLTSYPNQGVTTWNDNLDSYAYKYAFGAYLARNYGGAELVKNILANDSTNEASIVAALRQTTGNASLDFTYAVEKFAEAFIFSSSTGGHVIFNQTDTTSGHATFNQTDTKTIGGTTYTFTAFDIWKGSGNLFHSSWQTGPTIYALTSHPNMQPYSVYVQSSVDWVTSSTLTSLTLIKPAAAGVKQFLMVR
jgi:hypothetical protein